MNRIKLSICMPTYNFGGFIGEAIKSIVDQYSNEVEIIVGDGASTDNTEEVVRSFQPNYPNIHYHRFEKKGGIDLDLAKTINLAIGDYCWLMSSDDVIRPGAIARILDEIKLGHAIYLCNRTECDRNLSEITDRYWLANNHVDRVFDFSDSKVLLDYLKAAKSLGALFSYMSSIIVHRATWEGMNNNETLMGSNYAHVLKLFAIALNGGKVSYVRKSLVSSRLFNDSFMINGIAKRYLIDLNGYLEIADNLFPEKNIHNAFKSVMRKEHKWYHLLSLADKVTDNQEWDVLAYKLYLYGYNRPLINVMRGFGGSKRAMMFARYLRALILRWG